MASTLAFTEEISKLQRSYSPKATFTSGGVALVFADQWNNKNNETINETTDMKIFKYLD